MLKIDFGDCPVEKTYFGGTVNFSDKQIRFLFHYPECLVDEKYIANNQYAKDIYGLFGKFRDLEECPSLEEAYFLLFSHILISRSEVPYFYLEFVDSKKEVLEEVCIRDGKFEKITAMTEFGKIS
ncbi:MAG: hypothetical protein HFI09_03410, partial [Bacilli bacterium]|nr:hypothetical protein [Bacilli bacterium]